MLASPDHKNKTYELTASRAWSFEELASTLSELSGKPISHRQDPQVQNWIYGFLSKLDTSSTSLDLEQLIGGPVATLKESIQPFIAP
ncbi:hypothetical protein [Paenibacillus radicis (ex Xue et al. 2023)]|uniref:Uncharacterized protein n=1 Tax=Paenibacillus radicis (ex Xue et al. 2023) TaxID=2972489 RepID=A0ABT1YUN0_9BACL|nr:hypothetical protein [Paenibacillus radicis (ex Xue et al. 2023)]MCR8636388.1 hypothetical protein [Paenibacillus radicis (ex Xue et al. 2023)]